MGRTLNLSGRKVCRLTVLTRECKSKNGSWIWKCSCDCGNIVEVLSSSLNSNLTRSCGCLYDEIKGKQRITHGLSKSPTYNSWLAMRQRCNYEKSDEYFRYGGAGVSVCDSRLNSFENFLSDMGERPEGMTLDRIEGDKGYYKGNCRWATPVEQSRNTKVRGSSTSGVKGVTLHSTQNKWQASITVNGESIYLGIFDYVEDAIKIRLEAEEYYWK